MVLGGFGLYQLDSMSLELGKCLGFTGSHKPAVADHIRAEDRGEPAGEPLGESCSLRFFSSM